MRNKFFIVGVILSSSFGLLMASGTFSLTGLGSQKSKLARAGKIIFKEKLNKEMSCYRCHKSKVRLSRSSLKSKKMQLESLITICITDKERLAINKNDIKKEHIDALKAYLQKRYRF